MTIERITPSLYKEYPPIRLYLDDLEKIEHILSESKYISIRTAEYKFDGFDELKKKYFQNSGNISIILNVSTQTPVVQINLGGYRNSLFCSTSDVLGSGFFTSIDSILKKSSRRAGWPQLLTIYVTLSLSSFALGATWKSQLLEEAWPYVVGASASFLSWAIWVFYISSFRKLEVVMGNRGQSRGFFLRNRDSLVVAIISAAVSVALTLIMSRLFSQAKP